ncbi:polyketide cyclase [Nocardioides sp. Root190]|uniref:SRPBCC family protein n=1 Tax=Nocardioides sp. Root190 TaxID=1736488 RepID=UPI0006FA4F34|nr:SRPBCC family protein [Nocardioides sp. Root190]KRB77219.1 polyketide cyclase [Nocardioides sp. Root190]
MALVTATVDATIPAPATEVLAALADYVAVRPGILPANYSAYEVVEKGIGDGTVVTWQLQATKKRVRHVVADVTLTPDAVVETDRNSTMVTTFAVVADGAGSKVTATTTWQGAGGVGGFFEKTFAPLGLGRIHGQLLTNLAARLT